MIQLVYIAPGVVFSSDVLGVRWLRKHLGDGFPYQLAMSFAV